MTATSTALSQCDIILEILRHLTPPRVYDVERRRYIAFWSPDFRWQSWYEDTDAKAKRAALARLARTCRAFSEHALNALWAAPPGGLYTVLSLLSAFGCTEVMSAPQHQEFLFSRLRLIYQNRRYTLQGAIPPDEWATFSRYAARIRAIGYHSYEGRFCRSTICDTVFDVLCNINGEIPLFPNLRFLAWQRGSPCNGADPTGTRIFRMLTSPSLSALALWHPMLPGGHPYASDYTGAYGCKSEVEAFVRSFPTNLQHVALDVNLHHPSDLLLLTRLRRLRTLVLRTVDLDRLQHFGPLEDLRTLKCALQPEEAYWDDESRTKIQASTPSLPAASLFPSLAHVVLRGPAPASLVVRLLSSVSSDTLSSIDIGLKPWSGDPDILVLINSLCHPRNFLSLTKVELGIPLLPTEAQQVRPHMRFVEVAEPLLHLRRLEVLQFVVHYGTLDVSDDDITQMTRAWPHIVELDITYCDHNRSDKIHPSLYALVGLARQCRALESLRMDIRDVSEHELNALEEDAIACAEPQTNLVNLMLAKGGDTSTLLLPDVTRLACMLHALFPNLEGCGVLMPDERRREEISDSNIKEGAAGELLMKLDSLQKERLHRLS